nr:DNA-processing protein DprA [Tropicimonas sp. IMCC34043]
MTEHDGDADAAIAALPQMARAAGIDGYAPCPTEVVERELKAGRKAGARPLFYGDAEYPAGLADLPDPPPVLWARGQVDLARLPAVALVGSRNTSSLGRRMARALSEGLGGAGFVVVSGLARGIDAAAHEGALATGTIAVVAGGVDVVYPQENAELTARIAHGGLILSEMPPGLQPQARHFPRRNRLISGLSRGVVVVEAAARSGSLITARDALDQGREVLAVPGHPLDPRAAGCNMLLRDGATLVRGPDDVLEALGTPAPRRIADTPAPRAAATTAQHPKITVAAPAPTAAGGSLRERILALLGAAPIAEDQLARDLSLPERQIADELLEMEMDGALQRQPGGLLARAG